MRSALMPPAEMLRLREPRRRVLVFAVLALLTLPALLAPVRAVAEEPKSEGVSSAPDFTATGVDGKTYRLSELTSKGPVLLDFWTTYCGPCMIELPKLQKLWEQYRDRGFTLVGVVCDDQKSAAKIKPTVQSKGFKFINLLDTYHKIGSLYSVRQFPVSVLVGKDGKIVTKVEGYKPGAEKEFEKKFLPLLPEAPSAK